MLYRPGASEALISKLTLPVITGSKKYSVKLPAEIMMVYTLNIEKILNLGRNNLTLSSASISYRRRISVFVQSLIDRQN